MAQFLKSRHPGCKIAPNCAMSAPNTLLETFQTARRSLSLQDLLDRHHDLAKRIVQWRLSQWAAEGILIAEGILARYGLRPTELEAWRARQ